MKSNFIHTSRRNIVRNSHVKFDFTLMFRQLVFRGSDHAVIHNLSIKIGLSMNSQRKEEDQNEEAQKYTLPEISNYGVKKCPYPNASLVDDKAMRKISTKNQNPISISSPRF